MGGIILGSPIFGNPHMLHPQPEDDPKYLPKGPC